MAISDRALCWTRFASLGLFVVALGCSDRLATYPVKGKVQFATGGPVHVGTVELKSREHGIHARGEIQMDGTFTLTTYMPGDGAVQGVHDCVVVQMVMTEGLEGHKPSTIGVVDRRFSSYSSSGLSLEVFEDKPNDILLEVDGLRKTQPDDHKH